MWGVVGGLVGARLFHVIDRWDLYAANPLQILNLSEGGLAVYGGLLGGFLTGLVYAIRAGLPVWDLADAAAPGMLPWAFIYTNPAALVPPEWLGVPLAGSGATFGASASRRSHLARRLKLGELRSERRLLQLDSAQLSLQIRQTTRIVRVRLHSDSLVAHGSIGDLGLVPATHHQPHHQSHTHGAG